MGTGDGNAGELEDERVPETDEETRPAGLMLGNC